MKKNVVLLSAMVVLLVPCPVQAQESRNLTYKRRDVQSQQVRRPRQDVIPQELVMKPTESKSLLGDAGGKVGTADGRNLPRRIPGRTDREPNVDGAARRAADHTAREMAAIFGFREYYQIGFFRGLQRAFHDNRMGERDFQQGLRQGRRDRAASNDGSILGRDAAAEISLDRAVSDVEGQFRNLSREPNHNPDASLKWEPFQLDGPAYEEPAIQELFHQNPIQNVSWWRNRDYQFRDNWAPNCWELYNASSYEQFYNASWKNSNKAFTRWCQNRRNEQYYNNLDEQTRARFKQSFRTIFDQAIGDYYHSEVAHAHDYGWNDGWEYGAWMNQEWRYRQGFHQGAAESFTMAAENAYHQAYPNQYRAAYRDAYNHWSNNAVPEIEDITLIDANNNGVVEPGETVRVSYVMVNYGGASGDFQTSLQGPLVNSDRSQRVRIPGRSRKSVQRGPGGVISARAPIKQATMLSFTAGPLDQQLEVYISWPLLLEGVVATDYRDNLNGSARVSVSVRNVSNKTQTGGRVSMHSQPQPLGRLAPGDHKTLSFEVTRMNALDMLAGRASVSFELNHSGKEMDRFTHVFPEQVTDLENRDLLTILLDLARQPGASSSEVQDAQDLMLQRMRADWVAAVRVRGNPYKADNKRGTANTALGDLVRTYQEHAGSMNNRRVFTHLQGPLMSLSRELKGAHPFLRKHFRRLVKKLN